MPTTTAKTGEAQAGTFKIGEGASGSVVELEREIHLQGVFDPTASVTGTFALSEGRTGAFALAETATGVVRRTD